MNHYSTHDFEANQSKSQLIEAVNPSRVHDAEQQRLTKVQPKSSVDHGALSSQAYAWYEKLQNSVCRQQTVCRKNETYRDGRGIERLGQLIAVDMDQQSEQDAVLWISRERLAALLTEENRPATDGTEFFNNHN